MLLSVCVHQVKQIIYGFFWLSYILVVSAVKRALCCFRRRKSDADVVPLTTIGVIPNRQIPDNEPISSCETWENWGHGNTVREQIEDYRYRQQIKQTPAAEPPPQFYFQDMEPQIKSQAQVLIKSNNPENKESPSRLALVSDLPATGAELETWEENRTGWEEAENWSGSASERLKESRRPLGIKLGTS